MSHIPRRVLPLTLLLVVGLALPAPTSAASWLPVQTLSAAGGDAENPQVAFDPFGTALALWQRDDGANLRVQAASRSPGGSFGAVQNLSAAGGPAVAPQVAFDPSGNALAVWQRFDGVDIRIQAASRLAGGSFGAAQNLSAPGENGFGSQVALDPAGNALVVWTRNDGVNNRVQAASRPAGGSFGAVQTLSAAGETAGEPQVAFDAAGNALVVWRRFDGASDRVQASFRPAGGSFGAVQNLSAVSPGVFGASGPQVAFDPAGNALATWGLGADNTRVQVAFRPAGGSFGTARTLSPVISSGPQIAFDTAGNALAVWTRTEGGESRIQAGFRPAGGSFEASQDLSAAGGTAFSPQIAFDVNGNALAVWQRDDGAMFRVQSSFRPSNEFTLGKPKKNRKRGTAKLPVSVPGSGTLELAKTKRVKRAEGAPAAAGETILRIKPRGKAKKKLKRAGKRNQAAKAKVRADVTYTPTGADPNTKSKKLKLKRKKRR